MPKWSSFRKGTSAKDMTAHQSWNIDIDRKLQKASVMNTYDDAWTSF